MSATTAESQLITLAELEELLARIFHRNGVSRAHADILAANCTACERDGSLSHGIFRMPGYVATLRSGAVDGKAIARVEEAGPSFLRVDAMNGFAQPALAAATPHIRHMVASTGAVVVAIRRSHHFSALWPDLEPFAESGLIAISMVTGLACVTSPGGIKRVFGTNPIAFAAPAEGGRPIIFDFATASMSNGDLRLAAIAGRTVPDHTGVDRNGEETCNPDEILDGGALLPFGGHKGAALSLMVEILASAMTGGMFSQEVDLSNNPGAEIPNTGQALIVIDPTRGGNVGFAGRVSTLIDSIRGAGENIRLPSDRRYQSRAKAQQNGIEIDKSQYKMLCALAN